MNKNIRRSGHFEVSQPSYRSKTMNRIAIWWIGAFVLATSTASGDVTNGGFEDDPTVLEG